jgi:hypothetical protein
MKNYKKIAKISLIAFLLVMALLTVFSSTINNLGMAKVEVFKVTTGSLRWEYTAEGFIEETGRQAVFTMENEQLEHLLSGTEVTITSKTGNARAQGVIEEINKAGSGSAKDVIVRGEFAAFEANELVSMQFIYISPEYDYVVPASAVHGFGLEAFVYVVKKRQTSLGEEWYLQTVKVYLEESD